VLPLFLTGTLGAPAGIIGIVEGVAEACQYGIQGVAGWVADAIGRRKPLASVGYAVAAAGKVVIGLATVWPLAFAGRTLDRLGAGSRSAPRDALIAGSTDEAHRGKAFGLEGIGDNAGAFLGPLLALLVVSGFQMPLRSVFLLAFIPGILGLAMVLLVREQPTRRTESAAGSRALTRAGFPPAYWRYLAVTALFGAGNSTNAF
jgi:sugar phosphate permease